LGLAKKAESYGYESLWVGDSVLAKPRLEALTTLAAVAGATETIELGTSVFIPSLRNAVHVANQVAALDQLSGGRLTLGVGIGIGEDSKREFENLGISYESRASRLDETLALLRRLWSEESVTHDGVHYSLEDASLDVQPAGDLGFYVASAAFDPGAGFPETVKRRIVSHGAGWLPVGLSPESYDGGLEHLEAAFDDAGRDARSLDRACYVDVVVADTEAEAIQRGREFLQKYYPASFLEQFHDGLPDEKIRERGAFGPPSLVSKRLDAYVDSGVERFVVRFLAADQLAQQRRFAKVIDSRH
jgi:alkanesulfonate monooxygenase SsuD/methylene tetrahydromethanopterin reductase-like flavin-dependent oxidoreductase (luciferase family)